MEIYAFIGFTLAAFSVIANDSLQVLGTFIHSNTEVNWKKLWLASALVLLSVIGYSWITYNGSISGTRLNSIPFQTVQWYHAAAPAILLILTRFKIPVSTSLLVLSVFASSILLEKILIKSFVGYGIAAVSAYIIWWVLSNFIDETLTIKDKYKKYWRVGQWLTTGLLWSTWLLHDMANIAVFFPRSLPIGYLIYAIVLLTASLGYLFYTNGGKIQEILLNKSGIRFIRSATIIDFIYFIILYYFKELNNLPMSTTFVFIGLITGRELAIATQFNRKIKNIFPIVLKDFGKLMLGLIISIVLVLLIQKG